MKQARKLLKEKEEKKLAATVVDDEDSFVEQKRESSFSAFALLDEENIDEMYGEDLKEIIEGEEEEKVVKVSNNNRKKKKEKKKASKKDENITDEEFLERQIQELGLSDETKSKTEGSSSSVDTFQLFSIKDPKSLNPEHEFKRIFGNEAVSQTNAAVSANYEEHLPRVLRNNPHFMGKKSVVIGKKKKGNDVMLSLFVSGKAHWPMYRSLYLTTQLKSTKPNNVEIYEIIDQPTVTGSTTGLYAQIQQQYERALQSSDPDSFVYILQQVHPYHIHTLLQLSEVFRTMQRENDQAQDLNERALFAIQHILNNPQLVNSLLNGRCRLDSTQDIVKAIYLSILCRLHALARSGAHNTAFDLCRLLLSISCDPITNTAITIADPTHVLLFIDYYAIRIRKFKYIYHELIENFIIPQQPELQYLPNLMYSRALSLWKDDQLSKASEVLQEALNLWPMVLVALLTEMKTSRFQEFEALIRNTIFTTKICTSPIFSKLISAYARRSADFWKEDNVLDWLKYNIEEVLNNKSTGTDFDKLRDTCYQHPVFSSNYSLVYEKEVLGEILPDLNYSSTQTSNTSGGRRNPLLYFLESLLPWTSGTTPNLNTFLGGNDDEAEDFDVDEE